MGTERFIYRNDRMPLSTMGRYHDIPEIARYEASGCPAHSAIHFVQSDEDLERMYCRPHAHTFGEVNVLVAPEGALRYRILLGDDEVDVSSPATIWIPAGLVHSANLLGGTGAFVVVYVESPHARDDGRGTEKTSTG